MLSTSELIQALNAAGLTQKEIERRSGVPQPRLSRWKNGDSGTADDALKLRELWAQVCQGAGDPATPATEVPAEAA